MPKTVVCKVLYLDNEGLVSAFNYLFDPNRNPSVTGSPDTTTIICTNHHRRPLPLFQVFTWLKICFYIGSVVCRVRLFATDRQYVPRTRPYRPARLKDTRFRGWVQPLRDWCGNRTRREQITTVINTSWKMFNGGALLNFYYWRKVWLLPVWIFFRHRKHQTNWWHYLFWPLIFLTISSARWK